MTIGTPNIALGQLSRNAFETYRRLLRPTYLKRFLNVIAMVELQDDRISLSAIDAWVRELVFENKLNIARSYLCVLP